MTEGPVEKESGADHMAGPEPVRTHFEYYVRT